MTGLLAVVVILQVAIAAGVLLGWREVRRSRHEVLAGLRPQLAQAAAETTRELRTESDRRARAEADLADELAKLRQSVAEQRQALDRTVQSGLRQQFQQWEALAALYHDLRPVQALPATRNWAASPDLLHYLYRAARDGSGTQFLECGSGVSTLVIAYGLRQRGEGRVTALEHDPHYAEGTRALLRQHGLTDWAQVIDAPLEPVELEGESWPWYQLSVVPPGPFDLVLVDGPPGATREHARYPAVPLLYARLAPGGAFVLDDHDRPEEQEVARRWTQAHPELALERLRHEKGTAVLRHVGRTG